MGQNKYSNLYSFTVLIKISTVYMYFYNKALLADNYISFHLYINILWKSIQWSISCARGECSVQFSHCSCLTLQNHEPQHARPPCSSSTLRVYTNTCPLSPWCHPAISSSVIPSSSCPQSFPSLGFFRGVSSSYQVVKVLEFQFQHRSFQGWISFRMD